MTVLINLHQKSISCNLRFFPVKPRNDGVLSKKVFCFASERSLKYSSDCLVSRMFLE